jgi:uncharacterized membrane protein
MKSFSEISIGVLIILIITVLIETYIIHINRNKHIDELDEIIDDHDTNIVNKRELKQILKKHSNKKNTMTTINGLLKSCKSGVLRGCLMGLLTGGVGGAITYGTVLGVVNPVITGVEHFL